MSHQYIGTEATFEGSDGFSVGTRYSRSPSCTSLRRLVSRRTEPAPVCFRTLVLIESCPFSSIDTQRSAPLRKRHGQRQFRERDPLLGLILPANRNELVAFGDINVFHGHGHTENLCLERKSKVVLHHWYRSQSLVPTRRRHRPPLPRQAHRAVPCSGEAADPLRVPFFALHPYRFSMRSPLYRLKGAGESGGKASASIT